MSRNLDLAFRGTSIFRSLTIATIVTGSLLQNLHGFGQSDDGGDSDDPFTAFGGESVSYARAMEGFFSTPSMDAG